MQPRIRWALIAGCVLVLFLAVILLFVRGGAEDKLPLVSGSITLKRKGIRLPAAQGSAAGKTVEYLGDPVESARVTFMQGTAEVGFGVTDANGRYRIKLMGEDRIVYGLPPGAYSVKVTRLKLVADPEAVAKGAAPLKSSGPNPTLPAKYADPETSGLTAVVVEPPAEPDLTKPPPNFFPFVLEE